MKRALMLTAALCPLTACGFLTRHVPAPTPPPPANLTSPCPPLEEVQPADLGELLQECSDTAVRYRACAARHNELATWAAQ